MAVRYNSMTYCKRTSNARPYDQEIMLRAAVECGIIKEKGVLR